jgi:lysophospholipase L1-like esterase
MKRFNASACFAIAIATGALLAGVAGCGSDSGSDAPAHGGATASGGAAPTAGSAPITAGSAPITAGAPAGGAPGGGAGATASGGDAAGGAANGGAGPAAGAGGALLSAGAGGSAPQDVPPCATNQLSKCSGSPLACHFGGDPGNYEVTVELGGASAGETEVEAEYYRRMLTQTTTAGETKRFSFVTNVRVYEGEPLRPDQDGTSKGIPGLDVYFRGTSPRPVSICYQTKTNPLMLWIEGDSTVTDQESTDYSGWAQHLPQHFLSPISVANYADSGESSSSVLASAKLWPVIKKGMKSGDWVMVQLGHNDKDISAAAFKANMTTMVKDVKAAGAHMILVTPISRVGYTLADEHVNSTGANLPQIIRDLGKSEDVPVIDLTVTTWNWLQTIKWQDYFALGTDHTHTNPKGADIVSGFVRDAVKVQVPELAKYLR